MLWLALALAVDVVLGVATLVRLVRVGKLTLDTGWGRTFLALGPIVLEIHAPRELVFEQISAAYLGRAPKSLPEHLEVVDRGTDLRGLDCCCNGGRTNPRRVPRGRA